METLLLTPYLLLLLLLLLLPLFLYLIFSLPKGGSGPPKNLPPGYEGWPILGENVALFRLGSQQLVRDRLQQYSPALAFKTALFGEKVAVLCGAQGHKFAFTNENTLFASWRPLSMRRALFPGVHSIGDHAPAVTFSAYQAEILRAESLQLHVAKMDELAREHLRERWNPTSAAAGVLPLAKRYALEVSCAVFMDVADARRLEKWLEPLSVFSKGLVPLPAKLPLFSRAGRAGDVVRGELRGIINERRREMLTTAGREGRGDLLSKVLAASGGDGGGDEMIVNMILGLLVAAQYEVSAALTVVIGYLAELPHIYDEVFKEQMAIAEFKGPDKVLAWEDVENMKYTWNVVRECFRITPPSLGTFREAKAEFTFGGFTIPKGWKMLLTGHTSHMNPDYFPEPEKFDPSRFEGSGPTPYSYIPFGGGAKMCPGRGYVKLVILVFIHNLVTRFRFRKVIPNEKMLFAHVSPAPAHGLPLHLHPHQN